MKVKVLVTQSCLTLCDSMDCSPPGSFVHGILQARILVGSHFFRQGNFPDSGMEPRSATLLEFPGRSDSKEPVCSTGDPGSIPGLGRSSTDGKGYPLQYSWASVVAQLVKNTPAMGETWVRSLGWKDPLEKGTATKANILAWRIPETV